MRDLSSVAWRSGYRFHVTDRVAAATASPKAAGGGRGLSLVLSRTATSSCGEW